MPLMSIPGEQAFANLHSDRNCLWPDGRRDKVRLSGVAKVDFQPSFQLEPGEPIFTVGSCFARNLEQRLAQLGFHVPARDLKLPAEERSSETENDFLNKYPPHAVLNEFRWALESGAVFPEAGLLHIRKDLWHDPHSAANLKPASLERVRERRSMVDGLYRQLPNCRVVVMTLGLIEAWWDAETGHYLNGAPPGVSMQAHPGRFRLDVLTAGEVLEALEEIYGLLERHGHPDFRLLLTVSPVPMKSTFTGQDAITANTYSKSVLRVAAEMFFRTRERVDYFPSYEIVTHTVRSSAYIQDNRHVTPQIVDTIVDRVVEAYCGGLADAGEEQPLRIGAAAAEIHKASKTGDFPRAAKLLSELELKERYLRAGYTEEQYRYEFGRVLLRVGQMAEAQAQLARAVEIDSSHAQAHYQLARALARLQRPLEAEESFRTAAVLSPEAPEIRLGWANQLAELGRLDEAEQQVQAVLKAIPGDPRATDALAAVRTRMSAEVASVAQPQSSRGRSAASSN